MTRGSRLRTAAAATAALVSCLIAAAAWGARDDTLLASRASDGAKANGPSIVPAISADGRFVAFQSTATNLDPADTDPLSDVYVHDLATGTTTLVSRADGAGAKGNGLSDQPAISADGRFVAFSSEATTLDPADADTVRDVYVRDLQTGDTTLASVAAAKGDDDSLAPALSADGSSIAFVSNAGNLDPADSDIFPDVYVRDRVEGVTTLVSRASGAAGAKASFGAAEPSISALGRFVAFSTQSDNLDGADADTTQDVYVRDLQAASTTLVSRTPAAKGNGASVSPSISGDGNRVAFVSTASNLHPDDGDGSTDVFVRDLAAGTITLASRASGATGAKANAATQVPALSPDGRFVAFHTPATNLHADDVDTASDVFVRDLQDSLTALVSRASGSAGAKGNGAAALAAVSSGAGFVTFQSSASNLHPDDADATNDIFVRDVGGELGAPPHSTPTPAPTPGATPPAEQPQPTATPEAPAPQLGRIEVVEPLAGVVRIRLRGRRRFVRLRRARAIPDGSEIDTRRGRVRLTVDRGGGETESAEVSEGRAIVDQNTAVPPTTALRLSQPLACRRAGRAVVSRRRRKARRARKRRLFIKTDGGRFRTRGRYAAATASGTAWRTTDACSRTRIAVREGTVVVRDLPARRRVVVRAPDSYTARRRPRGRRGSRRQTTPSVTSPPWTSRAARASSTNAAPRSRSAGP